MKLERQTREGTGTFVNVLFFLGVLVLLQILSFRHPREWDFTKNKNFSLSPMTKQILSRLQTDLDLWAFVLPEDQTTHDLVEQYETYSSKVRVHWVDPRSRPAKAREMEVNGPPPILVAEYENRREQITRPGEENITNTINRLLSGQSRTVCFLEGHGEPDLFSPDPSGYSQFRQTLSGENYTVKTLVLFKENKIPPDASALIDIDPKYPPLSWEKNLLKAYLETGGRLLFLCGMNTPNDWTNFLDSFGFKIGSDLVMDSAISVLGGGPEFLATNSFSPHPVNDPFLNGRPAPPILLPLTRSVGAAASLPKDASVLPLITTSPQGKAVAVKRQGRKLILQTSRKPVLSGVVPVAEALTLSPKGEKQGRAVVVGSGIFADNQWFGNSATPNKDFALNAVSWLTENRNTLSIAPKPGGGTPLLLDRNGLVRLFLLTYILLPGLGIVAGFTAWLRRSRA